MDEGRRASPPSRYGLEPDEQFTEIHVESYRQTSHQVEAWIPASGFQAGDVRPIDVGTVGEGFLRETEPLAVRPHPITELDLPGSPSLVRASHGMELNGRLHWGHPNRGHNEW